MARTAGQREVGISEGAATAADPDEQRQHQQREQPPGVVEGVVDGQHQEEISNPKGQISKKADGQIGQKPCRAPLAGF
jgi:hypothetical protein